MEILHTSAWTAYCGDCAVQQDDCYSKPTRLIEAGQGGSCSTCHKELEAKEEVPEMPADIAWLYIPQSRGSLYEPPIAAPIWEDVEDEEPEELAWEPEYDQDANAYFYYC